MKLEDQVTLLDISKRLKEKARDTFNKRFFAYAFAQQGNPTAMENDIGPFLDSLIDQVREETLKEAEASLPGKLAVTGEGVVWNLGYNSGVADSRKALRSLTTHQEEPKP
jgi:hypothetical protein